MGSIVNLRRSSIVIILGNLVPLHIEAAAIHEFSARVMMVTREYMIVEISAKGLTKVESCYCSHFQIPAKKGTLFRVEFITLANVIAKDWQ